MSALPERLYFDLRPLSFLKPRRCKEEAGDLVRQDAKPDTNDTEPKHISAQIGADGADESNADCGGDGCVKRVSRTAQTAHIDHLADLESNHEDDDPHDSYADRDNMLFLKEEPHHRPGAEEIQDGETYRNNAAKHSADTAELFRHFFIICTKTPPDQGDGSRLQAVSKGEGKSHDIHAYLMRSHRIGSLVGGHDRRHHEADPHEELFKENTVSYMDQIM